MACLVALPLALVSWIAPSARTTDRATLMHELTLYPSVLVAGVVLYVCCRLAANPTTCWLTAGVTLVGAQGIGHAAIRIARPAAFGEHAGWLAGVDLVMQVVLIAMTVLAARHTLRVDPFLTGLVAGVAATAARLGVLELPSLGLSETTFNSLRVLLFVGQVAVALLLVRLPRSPMWLRARIGVAIVLLALSRLVVTFGPLETWGNTLAVLCTVTGTAVLLDTAFRMFTTLARRHGNTVRGLHDRLEHLEADVRHDRARLHELGATIAGIANASRLLHAHTGLPADRRQALERTIAAEASRLQRLMDRRHVAVPEEVDLDDVLEPVVTTHEARGRVITWERTGATATCRPDDIAEVVNILLENAAQHAGTPATLTVVPHGNTVEVAVTDEGPGVPAEVAPNLFAWGKRGAASTGQGIGLSIAHRLMVEQGGDLRLAPTDRTRGARLVAVLPAAPRRETCPSERPHGDAARADRHGDA
ncbi:sensor histidine kinase [Nocardioides abyssi]|uniref:histidine kinase n=1 Tax=Nocardioides abyssi TaxID=3058370 RepID=A0ABT8EUS8_9ACTN|nr:HAMP domain-containing sensor histidine kinase [Nocardioides abyssi]MDN4161926.1 HAMP domain-containing sensor histidine kinase [Nocardioides abyssi]